MKRKIIFIIAIIITLIVSYIGVKIIFFSPSQKQKTDIAYWTCGMHPQVKRKGPGKCPICAMDLVPVKKKIDLHKNHDNKKDDSAMDKQRRILQNEIKLDHRSRLLAKIKTSKIIYQRLSRTIRTVGKVDYDEKSLAHVAAWIGGRVDTLLVNFTGSYVRKGQALLKIYSPKLISTQEEYITLLKGNRTINTNNIQNQFINSVRRRLKLHGLTENQLKTLEKNYKVASHTTIYSPISGTVIKKYVHEGMYFKEGQNFYDIANLSRVWVYADIYEYEMSLVRKGQSVKIELPSQKRPLYGRITFIDPFLNPKTRTVKVRAEFFNAGFKLKPNMYVNATINIPTRGRVLAVPKTAVLDTGIRQVVYIEKKPGIYIMRQVKIGTLRGDFYPVKKGLKFGEKVVTSGAFLVDSQSQLTGGSSLLFGGADKVKDKPKVHRH